MKTVNRGLLCSAAGLFAVGAAQAADLPAKAAPVQYVKVCDLYGAGFWYVPGTDTCIKIGAYTKVDFFEGAGGGGGPTGFFGGGAAQDGGGANTVLTNNFAFRNRNDISFDMRTQTEYGTLRSYIDVGSTMNNQRFRGARPERQRIGAKLDLRDPRLPAVCRVHGGPHAVVLRHGIHRRLLAAVAAHERRFVAERHRRPGLYLRVRQRLVGKLFARRSRLRHRRPRQVHHQPRRHLQLSHGNGMRQRGHILRLAARRQQLSGRVRPRLCGDQRLRPEFSRSDPEHPARPAVGFCRPLLGAA